jgi:hypothetical protein
MDARGANMQGGHAHLRHKRNGNSWLINGFPVNICPWTLLTCALGHVRTAHVRWCASRPSQAAAGLRVHTAGQCGVALSNSATGECKRSSVANYCVQGACIVKVQATQPPAHKAAQGSQGGPVTMAPPSSHGSPILRTSSRASTCSAPSSSDSSRHPRAPHRAFKDTSGRACGAYAWSSPCNALCISRKHQNPPRP